VPTEAVCSVQHHQDNSVSFIIKCVALQIKTLHFTHAPSLSDRSWGAERWVSGQQRHTQFPK